MVLTMMKLKLIDEKTGKELNIGDKVKTFRGEEAELQGWCEPLKPTSTGRIYIKLKEGVREFFPSVIGACFVEP